MAMSGNAPEWYSRAEAMGRLGVGDNALNRLVRSGRIGVLCYPGLKQRKFRAADIEAVVAAGFKPATVGAESRAPAMA